MTDYPEQPPKKAVTIHDISCFGRCAQTVIISVLSHLGVQTIPLPTALLSTHTGGFDGFTFLDLTQQMKVISSHWEKLNLKFDSVYSGFLGSEKQIRVVADFVNKCKSINPDLIFLADPVMGDDGIKYKTYTDEMCTLTRELVKKADIITPNLTEACILTDTEYAEFPDENLIDNLLIKLSELTKGTIVITGIRRQRGGLSEVGCCYCEEKKRGELYCEHIGENYPGTGDVLASVVLAGKLNGKTAEQSVKAAQEFISLAASATYSYKTPVREGLAIENVLSFLHL